MYNRNHAQTINNPFLKQLEFSIHLNCGLDLIDVQLLRVYNRHITVIRIVGD